jgi:GT2 family glycosyltransferase
MTQEELEQILKQGAKDGARVAGQFSLEKKLLIRAAVEQKTVRFWECLKQESSPEQMSFLKAYAREKGLASGLSNLVPSFSSDISTEDFLSVVIPNLNGFPHLSTTLKTLRETDSGPTEIILVDNGSKDGSREWLEQQPDVHLIKLPQNLGAPSARNIGLKRAKGRVILMCDNDVVFTPGWRKLLFSHLGAWPDIGIVGPMSDHVSGVQKLELPELPVSGEEAKQVAAELAQKKAQHGYCSRLILFFMLVRREVIDRIGGIDEAFNPWGFEDDDYCLRARIAGFQLRVARDCFIQHLGSQTAKSANLNYQKLLLEKWVIYKNKWGLDPLLPYGSSVDLQTIVARAWPESTLHFPLSAG